MRGSVSGIVYLLSFMSKTPGHIKLNISTGKLILYSHFILMIIKIKWGK